jgi:hypothetical protein
LVTIHIGHRDLDETEVRLEIVKPAESNGSAHGNARNVALHPEQERQRLSSVHVIVDYQYLERGERFGRSGQGILPLDESV